MHTIRRSIDVDFSHHIRGHQGPCINLHGHTWKLEVGLRAQTLDRQGFVVDFGRLSQEVLRPCHALLDHSLAVGEETFGEVAGELEGLGARLLASREALHGRVDPAERSVVRLHGAETRYPGGLKVAVFPFSPTSERLAEWLHGLARTRLEDDRVQVAYARIYETLHPVESVAEFG
ncbi:MAG: 6-pyruvoyl trahydropterin synthase family protein [Myxococcota bacterium]